MSEDVFAITLVVVGLGGGIYMVVSNWLWMRKAKRKLAAIEALYNAEVARQEAKRQAEPGS